MPRRVVTVAGVALVVAALAAYTLRPARGVPPGAPTEDAMAHSIGAPIMLHLYRGHVPGRSGEVMTVPKPYRYIIGQWDLTTLASDTPTTTSSHPNPWAYTARVPIIFYGPGFVPAHHEVRASVDSAGIAPTYAALLGMDHFNRDGRPFTDIVRNARGSKPPRVIVTFVMDGGGWDVLQQHPDQWPTIARLRKQGTTFVNATIGSAPSITGAIHATIGTGDYPRHHGIPGNQLRAPNGANVDAYRENADPRYLRVPTLSDLWDKRNGNRPWVGTVSYEGWHLGMTGHGAQLPGGDKDVAVLWDAEHDRWWTNQSYYTLPPYLQHTDLARLSRYEHGLDRRDGLEDGTWFGHSLDELQQSTVRPGTPAFARFTGDAAISVMKHAPLGRDNLTDLFWVEMKMPDFAGHAWNMLRPEEGDVLFEVDHQLARIKEQLDRSVGRGNYVIAITADHGQQPLPELFGGWRINSAELASDIDQRFGADIVSKVTTVDLYMNMDEVKAKGISLDDVARYIATYTIGDNIPANQPGADEVPQARLDETLFAGAFSTSYLQGLTPARIQSFGPGAYPQGDLGLRGPSIAGG